MNGPGRQGSSSVESETRAFFSAMAEHVLTTGVGYEEAMAVQRADPGSESDEPSERKPSAEQHRWLPASRSSVNKPRHQSVISLLPKLTIC